MRRLIILPLLGAVLSHQGYSAEKKESLSIFGTKSDLKNSSGAADKLYKEDLEKFQFQDLHNIVNQLPGVMVEGEDGFGLRLNIGMRGASPHRSKKILLLEEGTLMQPAPYSKPGIYHTPSTDRLESIEAFKGPAAILYGPSTVAGTINFNNIQIPMELGGEVNVAGGTYGYNKQAITYGGTHGSFGWMLFASNEASTGFKELDIEKDTGFKKQDTYARIRYSLNSKHRFEFKIGWLHEDSGSSYLGITEADFKDDPLQKYAGAQEDNMTAYHNQYELNYIYETESSYVITRAYYRQYHRDWYKLANLVDNNGDSVGLGNIIGNPVSGPNSQYLAYIKGADTTQDGVKLNVRHNDRKYISTGVAVDGGAQFNIGVKNVLKYGLRYHQDGVKRDQTQDLYDMIGGRMTNKTQDADYKDIREYEAMAVSAYVQDSAYVGDFLLSVGLRNEYIESAAPVGKSGAKQPDKKDDYNTVLPGGSILYNITEEMNTFFGVHKGFEPVTAGQDKDVDPTSSINYELGSRYVSGRTQADLIAYYNDYSNITTECSLSTGCSDANDNQQYDGGKASVWGFEAAAAHSFGLTTQLNLPVAANYTYTSATFSDSFFSDSEDWGVGQVESGDPLPYIPAHKLNLTAGIAAQKWEANVNLQYTGEYYTQSVDSDSRLELGNYAILNLGTSYYYNDSGRLYLNAQNITNTIENVSIQPDGARPNRPTYVEIGVSQRI